MKGRTQQRCLCSLAVAVWGAGTDMWKAPKVRSYVKPPDRVSAPICNAAVAKRGRMRPAVANTAPTANTSRLTKRRVFTFTMASTGGERKGEEGKGGWTRKDWLDWAQLAWGRKLYKKGVEAWR